VPRAMLSTIAFALLCLTGKTDAEERLVFISSFAAGDKGAIIAYHLDLDSGKLRLVKRTGGAENPFYLAVSPNQQYLYAIHAKQFGSKEPEQVAAYQLVGRTGELKLLNRQSARGSAACYLDVDATGRSVLVANYTTGSVAALPVKDDGSLGEATSFHQHVGSSVDSARQKGPHAHCIVVSPDNRFVFAADLGLDQVLAYRLDAAKATLTAAPKPFVRTPAGAGPRHLTFHPNGRRVYVVNELTNSVTLFDYVTDTGILTEKQTISTLPKDHTGKSYCADLKITPDARFLYATNRGHDSIAVYGLGTDGRLTLIAIEPSLGKGPQNLAITPEGKHLLCANMPGNNVALFRIDPKAGTLKPVGEPIAIESPSCIRILAKDLGPPERGHGLSEQQVRDGFVSLFDGKSGFGWSNARIKDGMLVSGTFPLALAGGLLQLDVAGPGTLNWERNWNLRAERIQVRRQAPSPSPVALVDGIRLRSVQFKPQGLTDITPRAIGESWKPIHHPKLPPERRASWSVKGDGVVRAVGGPGCLEFDKPYANIVLQLEVRTLAPHANGGVFFRTIPGSFMNGYEAQIYNRCHDGDPDQPATWATGAIDDRQNARRLVSRDGQWFHYTIIGSGDRIATWINGYQTADWRDERKENENPRLGKRTTAGTLQLQAHDAATDIEFRNIRIAEWK
jgi:6-phosphogluconolactonase